MPLISIEFGLFFLLFLPVYWFFAKYPLVQNWLLLLVSMAGLFYLDWRFAVAVLGFSMMIHAIAFMLSRFTQYRKLWLSLGLLVSLLTLAFFKYMDFFWPMVAPYFRSDDAAAAIFMPLGLSYYVFQSIAYIYALYKEKHAVLRWYELLLHFSFFPTITSGPIIRSHGFKSIRGLEKGALVQIQTKKPRQMIRPSLAVCLILLGIIKKWWLAGALATAWVSPVFANPLGYNTWDVLLAGYGYTVQLFLDFSGYSDLVIGLAMLLGFKLPTNFRMPLRAVNIRDFWDRWHISLSTWIRDHIYIPLGGSRKGFVRTQINLMIAMLLSGIWHGSGLTFIVWGFLHGFAMVCLNIGDKIFGRNALSQSSKLGRAIAIFITVNFVCFCFVIFASASLQDAQLMWQALFQNEQGFVWPTLDKVILFAVFALSLIYYPRLKRLFYRCQQCLHKMPYILWFIPITLIMMIVITLAPSGIPNFIYANF